jgi:sec-independent protein translocase protein TatA
MLFGKLGISELVLILLIVLIVFGPTKLPQLGKALGTGLKELKSHASKISGNTTKDDARE